MIDKDKHIDQVIKNALEGSTVAPSESFWNKAKSNTYRQMAMIEKQRSTRWRKRAMYLSFIALFFGTAATYLLITNQTNDSAITSSTSFQQPVHEHKELATSTLQSAVTSSVSSVKNTEKKTATKQVPSSSLETPVVTALLSTSQEPELPVYIEGIFEQEVQPKEILLENNITGLDVRSLTLTNNVDELTQHNSAVVISRKLYQHFSIGCYAALGKSAINIQDARSYDAQLPGDVMVKSKEASLVGINFSYRMNRHWQVSLGTDLTTTKTGITSHFFADTTGTGVVIVDPEESENEEGEGEGNVGNGNTTIQPSSTGYELTTNLGQVHLNHAMNSNCTLTNSSYQKLSYLSVPITLTYFLNFHHFDIYGGLGGIYHSLLNSNATLVISDSNGISYQNSSIKGLKKNYLSAACSAGMNYHLSPCWDLQLGIDYRMGLNALNSSTPFNSKMNLITGKAGLIFNF